jgi:hypothetical protein
MFAFVLTMHLREKKGSQKCLAFTGFLVLIDPTF